jgi:hypothetical protein
MFGLGKMRQTLAADDAQVEATKPGVPDLAPPPIHPPPTDPLQAFGQPAMWLAAIGGLLTRHPLTSAITSAGAVMDSVHKQDAAAAQRAYDEWKINSENAMKLVKYEQDAYKAALAKKNTDVRESEAQIKTLAAAFKNPGLARVLEEEGMTGVTKYVQANGQQAERASVAAQTFSDHAGKKISIAQGLLSDDPKQMADALRAQGDAFVHDAGGKGSTSGSRMQADAIRLQLDTIAARMEKAAEDGDQAGVDAAVAEARGIAGAGTASLKPPKVAKTQATAWTIDTDPSTNQQFRTRTGPDGKPEYTDLAGNAIEPPKGVAHVTTEVKPAQPGSLADTVAKQSADIAKEHPDWPPGRVATTANARVRLAASPFMQNLNQKEAQAAQKEIDKDPTILDDPNRMGQLVNQVTGRQEQKETLTGQQIAQIDDHATRVAHLLDDLQKMRGLLDDPAIASKLGRPLRAGESIGNILGAMNDTDRAEYDQLLARVRQEGPKLMSTKILPSETRPSEEEADALFPSQRWGDTKQNVDRIFEDWQNRFVTDLRVYNAQKLGSTGQGLLILGGGGKPAVAGGKVIRYDAQGNPIQ